MNYTEEQIESFIKGVYSGKFDASKKLPEDLYKAISSHLIGGLDKGLTSIDFGVKNEALTQELRDNVYMFSAAKTYQQVKEMGGFLADSNNFSEFKEKALGVYDQYNNNWLRAEYNTAYGQGTIANQWGKIENEKSTFPTLRYSAVMDANTSEECRAFDNTTLPVDDSFWDSYSPLNHFNCRCIIEQIDAYTDVKHTTKEKKEALMNIGKEGIDDVFTMNPYKDGYVFSPKHPYFEVAKKDKDFAMENFGLPIPEKEFNYNFELMDKKQMEQSINEIFDKRGFNVRTDLSGLPPKKRVEFMNQLQSLVNEYEFKAPINDNAEIFFKSTEKEYGYIQHNRSGIEKYRVTKMNFGNTTDTFQRTFNDNHISVRAKSCVDEKNLNVATLTHEFAHVLSISENKIFSEADRLFWDKMSKIKKEYTDELMNATTFKDQYKISLGKYANTNMNEFMAEGFTEYKLKAKPSKYAEKIGKLIDERFKIK